jgi:carboxyl-terminal processing protease
MLEKIHFKPQPLDDNLSVNIFKTFIETLDPDKLILTKEDSIELSKFSKTIDDEISSKSDKFITKTLTVYNYRLVKIDSLISEILSKPLNINCKDTFIFSKYNNLKFAKDEKDLKIKWIKYLKYCTLKEYFGDYLNKQKTTLEGKQISDIENTIRIKIKNKEQTKISNILNNPAGYNNYIESKFLNSISTCFDPHSNFFLPTQADEFEKDLSKQAFAFGFTIDVNENDEIQIERLIPGSSAWKSNILNVGDIVQNISWENGKSIDFTSLDIDDASQLISEIPSKTINITVLKSNGTTRSALLTKELLTVENNSISSYILNGQKKIGYIQLPDFYSSDMESHNVLGCSNDVAKEIIKLQKEKIDGLILDLRNNGGGSLSEALSLIGIFIDEGPLLIAQEKGNKPTLLKDLNRGTIYTGPLIVLVNGSSASASEIVAASLQDYNKAIIVGSPTYGKATGQIVLPIDTSLNLLSENTNRIKSFGFLKITCEKLYRLNGKSHQKTGVIPDIRIPDIIEYFDYRESNRPFCLSSDSIYKKVFYNPLPVFPINKLQLKSSNRLSIDSNFNEIKKFNTIHKDLLNKEGKVFLELTAYKKQQEKLSKEIESIRKVYSRKSKNYIVSNNNYDNQVYNINSDLKEARNQTLEFLQNDLYINESYKILEDLILNN